MQVRFRNISCLSNNKLLSQLDLKIMFIFSVYKTLISDVHSMIDGLTCSVGRNFSQLGRG